MINNLPAKYKEKGSASFSALFHKCKHAAKQRDLEFTLTKEEHKVLIVQICHYCGALPTKYNSYLKNKGLDQVRPNRYGKKAIERNWIEANGVDRKDNTKGYIHDNCLPCCGACNYLKCDISYEDFLKWIEKTYLHLFVRSAA